MAFPDDIYSQRELVNLPGIEFDAENKKTLYAEDISRIGNEVTNIENWIGTQTETFDEIIQNIQPAGMQLRLLTDFISSAVISVPGTNVLTSTGVQAITALSPGVYRAFFQAAHFERISGTPSTLVFECEIVRGATIIAAKRIVFQPSVVGLSASALFRFNITTPGATFTRVRVRANAACSVKVNDMTIEVVRLGDLPEED